MKTQKDKKVSPTMEDYLEAIAILKMRNGVARVRDISNFLNVKPPSVTSALNALSKSGFVVHEKYGYVNLTKSGEELARRVQERHNLLVKFLTNILGIDPKIANEDACKMEHILSPETFQKLTKMIEFIETCPHGQKPNWLNRFDYYFKTGERPECEREKKEPQGEGLLTDKQDQG